MSGPVDETTDADASHSNRGGPPDRLTIEPFTGDMPEWDRSLVGLEGATFCHLGGWRAVMEDALGHTTFWWVARRDDGTIEGLLPLVRVRSRLFGDYLVSMPFLNYGGPVGTLAARSVLAQHAASFAEELGVDLMELRTRARFPADPLAVNQRKVTVVKSLPQTVEELWEEGLRSKVRSQVRRPMKEGMEVHTGPELLGSFYDVFSTTMRDLGTPVLPRSFFESIRDHLGEQSLFTVVELDGQALAAGCGLHWNGELEITWAGSSREHSRMAPNMLLYWGMMEEAVRRGMNVFNFGRCTPDSGTHRFKRQWGTRDEALPWLHWSDSGATEPPNPESSGYRVAIDIWRRLPVRVTNFVGPFLSRILP